MGHLGAIASAVDQYQIELLKYKEKQGDLTFTERNQLNLCKRKEKNFKAYKELVFPGVKSDYFCATDELKIGDGDA